MTGALQKNCSLLFLQEYCHRRHNNTLGDILLVNDRFSLLIERRINVSHTRRIVYRVWPSFPTILFLCRAGALLASSLSVTSRTLAQKWKCSIENFYILFYTLSSATSSALSRIHPLSFSRLRDPVSSEIFFKTFLRLKTLFTEHLYYIVIYMKV